MTPDDFADGEAQPLCGATDGLGVFPDMAPDDPENCYGRCTLPAGHQNNNWHQERRDGEIWAEWRGPMPGETCSICGKDGSEH
jgi:hypothetical protein